MIVVKVRGLLPLFAVAALAACSSASPNGTPPFAPADVASTRSMQNAERTTEAAKAGRRVYVSDYSADALYVYDYPSGRQDATIGGLRNPQGMCADATDRNLFVANTGGSGVLVYAWGETSPHATYNDPGEYPVACSVDPATGNLAIADLFSPTTGVGGITICTEPDRCSTFVQPSGLSEATAVAYAGNGDLYAGGIGSNGFAMAYLRGGSKHWQPVTFTEASGDVPYILDFWDGRYLVIGASSQSSYSGYLYRCKASGPSIDCGDRKLDIPAQTLFLKYGGRGVVGVSNAGSDVATWAYPAGGSSKKVLQIHHYTYSTLIGTAILRQP